MGLTKGRRRLAPAALLGTAIVFVALNLRLPIGGVGPVLDDLRADVGLSNAAAGLLATVPVLCFGLAAPLAPRLVRRSTEERILLACVVVAVVGILMRISPHAAPLFAGTIVMSIGIAVANVLVPSIIKNGFAKPGAMLGWYTMALSASGAVGAALTVPLEGPLGSWRWALAAWAVPMVIAAIVWAPIALRTRTPPPRDANRPRVTLWRDRTSWWITALFACQALMFYSVFSWVPDILRDAGDSSATAGVLLSVVLLLGIPASALVPPLAARLPDQRRLAIGSFAMWATGLTGLLVSPGTASIVWMVALGLGQGSGIALALTLVVLRSPDGEHAAVLSGMVQGVGYTFAALGPIVVGLIHDATGGWEASLAILLGISCGFLVFGLLAGGRQTVVGSGRA